MDKINVYLCLHIASIKSTAGNKTRFFLSPFLISASMFIGLAKAFRNDYVSACSTALRSATEKNEMGGCVTVPCSSPKGHSLRAQRIGKKSSDVTRFAETEHIRDKYSLLKSRSVIIAVIVVANLLKLSIFGGNIAQVN